ncbi:bifunctional metallophosphatase/5'-nucleotidase [Nocardioides taihuensis]|uniref:Bifunctional metallophosphatase/5'-nucleotidase n=1 Tax=Nocardioides taihuensis TaxID=1835606 RepID=A0ABW0BMZ7_9ACTN
MPNSASTARRWLAGAGVASLALLGLTLPSTSADAAPRAHKPAPSPTVEGKLLAFNDFHGNIDPPTGSSGYVAQVGQPNTPAGGVEYLAYWIKQLRAEALQETKNVYTVAAGDLIGASPLVSAAFHDEPSIEEMNALGLDITSVGNHEFDEGVDELLRMQKGGCHPTDGCQDGDGFAGADFPMLAANVVRKSNGKPILPAYKVRKVGGIPVGFVGMTLEGTPSIVNPNGITSVDFLDEVETANKYAAQLEAQGVKSIVLLLHEGGIQSPSNSDIDGCAGFSGAVKDIVAGLDPAYGVVVSGHTHQPYVCQLPDSGGEDTLVTSAGSFGRIVTDVTFTISKATGKFVSASADNEIVKNGIQNPDGTWQTVPGGSATAFVRNPDWIDPMAKLIADKYRTAVAPIANAVVGSITADITRVTSPAGESPLGDVIADGMVAYSQSASPDFAIMNPGGIRADLNYAFSPGGEQPGQVTYGEAFTVQPFNNLVVTRTYTGAQIKEVLEQQFAGYAGQGVTKILQVSDGFTYSYSASAAPGSKVSEIRLNGVPLDMGATYNVTMNDFLAAGGDSFTNLKVGTNPVYQPGFDVDSLTSYLGTFGPVAPGPVNRITRLP